MSTNEFPSPFHTTPPSPARLVWSTLIAAASAALILLLVVLPAEYGIDPTGAGRALGLNSLHRNTRTLHIKDVVGGNENYRQVEIPAAGEPIPLPNPAVFQPKPTAARSESISIKLDPGRETEVKAVLDEAYLWDSTLEVVN
jgi:hypothetical protein